MNTIQEYAEGSRLGVPVLVSMDSVHGLSYVSGATRYRAWVLVRWRQPVTKTLSPVWRKSPAMSISPSAFA